MVCHWPLVVVAAVFSCHFQDKYNVGIISYNAKDKLLFCLLLRAHFSNNFFVVGTFRRMFWNLFRL